MKTLKKLTGILAILLAAATVYFCISIFGGKLFSDNDEDVVFASIVFFILMPLIAFGLALFGYFAAIGEYDEI